MIQIQEAFYVRVQGELAEKAVCPKTLGIGSMIFDHFYEGSPAAEPYYELAFKDEKDALAYRAYLTSLTFVDKEKVKILEDFIRANFYMEDGGMYLSVPHDTDVLKDMHPERLQYIRSIMEQKK